MAGFPVDPDAHPGVSPTGWPPRGGAAGQPLNHRPRGPYAPGQGGVVRAEKLPRGLPPEAGGQFPAGPEVAELLVPDGQVGGMLKV